MSAFTVTVDVSEARAGAREAIVIDVIPERMNPGDALRLAHDIQTAAGIVSGLAPPRALPRRKAPTPQDLANFFAGRTDDDGRRGD